MNVADTGLTTRRSGGTVAVGYFTQTGYAQPVLPAGYDLVPIRTFDDLKSVTLPVFLIGAQGETIADVLKGARKVLVGQSYLLALCEESCTDETRLRMLDAGADDVVNSSDTAALGLALKRAEKVLLREGDLKRRIREVSIERNNLQSAIDHLPSPIFFKDGDGVYTGCNKAFEEYLGLSSRQIVGSTVYDVSSSKYAGIYAAADLVLLKEGGVQIYDSEVCFPNGEVRFVTFHKAVTHDKVTGEVNGLAGAMLDITERKHLEKSLKHAAERDHLTGAFNRRKFFQIAEEIDRDPIRDELGAMVLVMDVDHFKRINDRYGHACGDEALKHLVSILQEHLPEPNIFARAGGEEFFAILRGFTQADAWRRADAIRRAVEANSFKFAGEAVRLTISIGAAMIGPDESVASAVLRADHALYRAKESGRNELAVD